MSKFKKHSIDEMRKRLKVRKQRKKMATKKSGGSREPLMSNIGSDDGATAPSVSIQNQAAGNEEMKRCQDNVSQRGTNGHQMQEKVTADDISRN